MRDFVHHAVRRAVQTTASIMVSGGDDVKVPKLPPWGAAIIGATVLVFIIVMSSLQYTLGDVIGTLTMIETPSTVIAVPLLDEEADVKDGVAAGPGYTMVAAKPITSGIRSTVNHITSIGGRTARWRAICPAILYACSLGSLSGMFSGLVPIPGRHVIGKVLATLVLARMHMAWTHALISMPSPLRWYQRLAPFKSVKKLWIPATVNALATYAVMFLTSRFAMLMGFCARSLAKKHEEKGVPKALYAIFTLQGLAVVLFAIFMWLFVVLPAAATLARVEASMLPEDQETIVPFDRTFNGKVVPEILGGSGAIGFADAWRTFNWEARRRLTKLYLKTSLIIVALVVVMSHVVLFEGWAILGPELGKALSQIKRSV